MYIGNILFGLRSRADEIEVNLMIIAVVVYDNADTQKESIIKDNRGCFAG